MNKESFMYSISSTEKTNSGTGNTYEIDVGKLNTSYDKFQVEVVSWSLGSASSFSASDDQILLTAQNFAEDYENQINSNECILSIANFTDTGMNGTSGVTFKTSGLRMGKKITFKIRMLDLSLATSGTVINVSSNVTYWLLLLRLTPID